MIKPWFLSNIANCEPNFQLIFWELKYNVLYIESIQLGLIIQFGLWFKETKNGRQQDIPIYLSMRFQFSIK